MNKTLYRNPNGERVLALNAEKAAQKFLRISAKRLYGSGFMLSNVRVNFEGVFCHAVCDCDCGNGGVTSFIHVDFRIW